MIGKSSSVAAAAPPKQCGEIHCVAIGDAHSGKKQLLAACEKVDSRDRPSYLSIEYSTNKVVGDFAYQFVFKGFSGQESRHNLRRLSYQQPTGVFLVCFSVVDQVQFYNAIKQWVAEIQTHAPGAPFLLVGTHADLRKDKAVARRLKLDGRRPVSRQTAEYAARMLGCKYLECSAVTLCGVKRMFNTAIGTALKGPCAEEGRKICMLM